MHTNDEIRLRHMLEAAYEAESFARGRKRADLDEDRMLVLSLLKAIEIVGEAASQVTDVGRNQLPSIPWSEIIGMRNRLVHVYFDIDLDIVYRKMFLG